MYILLSLSFRLSLYPFIRLYIYISLFINLLYLFIYQSIYIYPSLFIYLSMFLYIYLHPSFQYPLHSPLCQPQGPAAAVSSQGLDLERGCSRLSGIQAPEGCGGERAQRAEGGSGSKQLSSGSPSKSSSPNREAGFLCRGVGVRGLGGRGEVFVIVGRAGG